MHSLSRLAQPQHVGQQHPKLLLWFFIRRSLATNSSAIQPMPARVQMKVPAGENGVLQYERLYSRDNRYAAQKGHEYDTPLRFLKRSSAQAWELTPLYFCLGAWFFGVSYMIYWSLNKLEVQLNRSDKRTPLDWERIRENYWKHPTRLYDNSGGKMNTRLPILEVLQDEMLEAARERGTRQK